MDKKGDQEDEWGNYLGSEKESQRKSQKEGGGGGRVVGRLAVGFE